METTATSLQALDLSLPIGSLEAYAHRVNQIPMLTAEEEETFANRLFYHNDLDAARHLILPHLRFVASIARGYSGYGLSHADLIQEGNVGLMKAVKRFDPRVGVRLVSFAVHWIKAEIHEFIIRNWRIVKIATTKAQRKLFFNLRKSRKRLGWMTQKEVDNVAKTLNVSTQDVYNMEARLNSRDESFDGPFNDNDESWNAPANYLEDHTHNPAQKLESNDWSEHRQQQLYQALEQLDERSQDIVKQRWLQEDNKATLHDLAKKHGISAERVRQLEKQAMQKIKSAIVA